ncbi:MAG: ABC transporter ATP-binding protein, partial [Nitrospirae bacterium]|nr:ABC transporter ATP-binding protein [Nitrospirota bacterium]
IMVLHDLNLASQYCDRLLLFNNGTLCKDGTPEAVLTCEVVGDVYGTAVAVLENPLSSRPHIFLVPSKE